MLRDRSFIAAAAAHFAVDLINSQRALLLAFLSTPLALTNSAIGLVSTLYVLSASLSQPLFGALADRVGTRWVVAGGVVWQALFFAGAVVTPGYAGLALLVMAALGSAAFHPAGATEATLRGRDQPVQRETTAAAVFFVFGQSGLALGPAIGGPLLDRWGTTGLLLLPLLVLPTAVHASRTIRAPLAAAVESEVDRSEATRISRRMLPLFLILAAGRTWVQFNFVSFLPKYMADLGLRPTAYGAVFALYMAAVATGNASGGWLGDRLPRRLLVMGSLCAAALPIALMPVVEGDVVQLVVIPTIGLLIGISHSLIVVTAQNQLPGRMGAASGLILGFMFSTASLGTLVSGAIADAYGFSGFFWSTAALALLFGAAGVSMPARKASDPNLLSANAAD